MSIVARIAAGLAALVVLAVVVIAVWLIAFPPALIRVGSGYAAKIVCSNVFIAGRQPEKVLDLDVQAPGDPTLKLFAVEADRTARTVVAGFLRFAGRVTAVDRRGFGCTLVPDGKTAKVASQVLPHFSDAPAPPDALWPQGERVRPTQLPAIAKILDDKALSGPGMRAIVVVKDGRIIGERYGAGFSATTPLIGWSMTKTANAAIAGTVIAAGRLSLEKKNLFPQWAKDGRRGIGLADLMAMSSGLAFNEDYGDVSDVTRMLFLEPDMAGFAASKPLAQPVGKVFHYSSGAAVLISRIWQDALGDEETSLAWPRKALFDRLGMTSAVFETDEAGTFVGCSYLYADAHDWARFGELLLEDGEWNGAQILPAGYAAMMRAPAPASNGVYGKGQLWLAGPGSASVAEDEAAGVPAGTYWMEGHDGQTVAIVPSKRMVVVRMGLTPAKTGYRPQRLVAAFAGAVR